MSKSDLTTPVVTTERKKTLRSAEKKGRIRHSNNFAKQSRNIMEEIDKEEEKRKQNLAKATTSKKENKTEEDIIDNKRKKIVPEYDVSTFFIVL